MAPPEFNRFAFASRVRGDGSRALERPPGTFSPARRGRQHPERLSFDSGTIFSLSQTPDTEPVEKTSGGAHSQEPSTSSEIGLDPGRVCRGPIPACYSGSARGPRSASGQDSFVQRQNLL